jgi:hypothetical protein
MSMIGAGGVSLLLTRDALLEPPLPLYLDADEAAALVGLAVSEEALILPN